MNPTNIQNNQHLTATIVENHLWQWLPALSQLDTRGHAVASILAHRVFPKLEEAFSTLFPKEAWKPFVTILFWQNVPQGKEITMRDVNYLFFHTLKALYPEHFSRLNEQQAKTLFCWMSKETVTEGEVSWKLTDKTIQYKDSAISFDIQSVLINNPTTKVYQSFSRLRNWMGFSLTISYYNCCFTTPMAGWCRYFNNTIYQMLTGAASPDGQWMKEITEKMSPTLTPAQKLTIKRIFAFLMYQGIDPLQPICIGTRELGYDMYDHPIREDIMAVPMEKFHQLDG